MKAITFEAPQSRNLTPASDFFRLAKAAIRATFSANAAMAVGAITIMAMLWHIITITDPIASGEAVATDCLLASPWAIARAISATLSAIKEGGEA